MPDSTSPAQTGSVLDTPPVSLPLPSEYRAMSNEALDRDPELHDEIRSALTPPAPEGEEGTQEAPKKEPGMFSRMWQHFEDNLKAQADEGIGLVQGAVKGVVKGVANIEATAVHGAFAAAHMGDNAMVRARAFDVQPGDTAETIQDRQDAAADKFTDWYERSFGPGGKPYLEVLGKKVPLTVDDDTVDSWFGANRGHLGGFVEGILQFGTGAFLLGPERGGLVDKGVAQGLDLFAGISPVTQKAAIGAIESGASAAFAFDPHKPRISNVLQNAPAWLGGPLFEWLSAKPDDSDALARVKNVLEFTMTGLAAHNVLKGLGAVFGKMLSKGAPEALKALPAGTKGLPEGEVTPAMVGDLVEVHALPEGHFEVKPTGAPEGAPGVTAETESQAQRVAATFNQAAKNAKQPKGSLDDAGKAAWEELLKQPPEIQNDPKKAADFLQSKGWRMRYDQSGEQVAEIAHATFMLQKKIGWEAQGKEAVAKFGQLSPSQMLDAADPYADAVEGAPAVQRALSTMQELQARVFKQWSALADSDPTNAKAVEEMGKSGDTLLAIATKIQRLKSGAGRLLQMNQDTKAGAKLVKAFERKSLEGKATRRAARAGLGSLEHRAPISGPKIFSMLSPDEIRAAARVASVTDDPGQALSVITGLQLQAEAAQTADPLVRSKLGGWAKAYRLNAMLSGPTTLLAKVASDFSTMAIRPAEYFWAGQAMDMPELATRSRQMYDSLLSFHELKDSFKSAVKSFKMGEETLDPSHPLVDDGYGLRPLPKLRGSEPGDWLNLLVNAPSRALMVTTEFAKQMNYRAMTRALITERIQQAGITDPKMASELMSKGMEFAFTPEGLPTVDAAMEYAKRNTFTNDLRGMQKQINRLANASPLLDFLIPFRRVPANLFNYFWERAPLISRLNKDVAADLAAGGEREALARAKIQFGTSLFSLFTLAALSGRIVGGGPEHHALSRQWSAIPGNQRESFVWKDENGNVAGSMSFRKFEPFGTFAGVAADLVSMSGELPKKDYDALSAAVIASIVHTVASKSYLQDWTALADALTDDSASGVAKFQHLIDNSATSFIPNAATRLNPDNVIRETHGLMQEIKGKLPGFSTTLQPRYNIFGEPVMRPPGGLEWLNHGFNPFTISMARRDSALDKELVEIGRALPMPAETLFGGRLDLTDPHWADKDQLPPYQRLMQLVAEPAHGKSLRETLEKLADSPVWEKIPASGAYGPGGMKYELVRKIVAAYHSAAFATVLHEYPELREAWRQEKMAAAVGNAQGEDAAEEIRNAP